MAIGLFLLLAYNFLNSSDFRSWYHSEFIDTNSIFVIVAFLISSPLVIISSIFGLFLGSKQIFPGGTLSRIIFKYEIPALILLSVAKMLITTAPMTPGLRILFTTLTFILLTVWYLGILKINFRGLYFRITHYNLVTVSYTFVIYLLLLLVVPALLLFGEIFYGFSLSELKDFSADIINELLFDPFYLLHITLFLLFLIAPFLIFYFTSKKFIILQKSINLSEINKKILSKINVGTLVVFIILLFILSYSWSSIKYGEELVLLSSVQPQDSYSTLIDRARPIISNKEKIEKQLDKEFNRNKYYTFKRSDFVYYEDRYFYYNRVENSRLFNLYAQSVLFPFIDYRHDDKDYTLNAYENAYRMAFGINFNQNKKFELKQVQHLSRDIFINTENSDYLAEVTITDAFSTFVSRDQEVVLDFYLPENAVITNLLLGPELEYSGQIAPRGAAEQVYVEQVRRNIDPALLEQVGPRQYRLRVYPVPAQTKLAASQRTEQILGEIQRVQFTYLVMRDKTGIPLPIYSKNYNLLTSETKYIVQLDGKKADLSKDFTYVSDNRSLSQLCNLEDDTTFTLFNGRLANLTIGKNPENINCLTDKDLILKAQNLKINIIIDTAFANHRAELPLFLNELQTLPPEFYNNNDVQLVLSSGGKITSPKRLVSVADVPNVQEIIFVGDSSTDTALHNTRKDSDVIIIFSGLSKNMNMTTYIWDINDKYLKSKFVSFVYTKGNIPSYNQKFINSFSPISNLSVHDSVTEALKQNILTIHHRATNPSTVYQFGDYWTLKISDPKPDPYLDPYLANNLGIIHILPEEETPIEISYLPANPNSTNTTEEQTQEYQLFINEPNIPNPIIE